jgi:stage V sporulation protein B
MQESKKAQSEVIEGALSLTIATIVVKILGAIYKIPLSHVLGEEGMGYFNSAYTVYTFFFLLCTAGVPKAIMLLYANANEDSNKENKILRSALEFFAITGLAVSVAFSLLSIPLSKLIGSPNSYLSMIFIAPSILFSAISGVLRGYFSAKVKFLHVAISQIIEGGGKLLFGTILAMLSSHFNIPLSAISAFAILGATIGSLSSLAYLYIITKKPKTLKIIGQKVGIDEKTQIVWQIIKTSLPIAIGAMIMSITNIIDLGIVMRRLISLGYSSSAATSLYGNYTTFATPIFNTVVALFTPLTVAFMPTLLKARYDKKKLYSATQNELEISFFIFIPITIGVLIYSEEILLLLFDDGGVFLGSRLLRYMMLSILFIIPLSIINCTMEALGKVRVPMISMLVGGIFKIISGHLLIGNIGLGIIGAPISTLVFYGSALITSLLIAYKKTGMVIPIIRSLFLPLVNSFIAIYAVYPLYTYMSTKTNWIFVFPLSVALSVGLYLAINALQDLTRLKSYVKPHNAQI